MKRIPFQSSAELQPMQVKAQPNISGNVNYQSDSVAPVSGSTDDQNAPAAGTDRVASSQNPPNNPSNLNSSTDHHYIPILLGIAILLAVCLAGWRYYKIKGQKKDI